MKRARLTHQIAGVNMPYQPPLFTAAAGKKAKGKQAKRYVAMQTPAGAIYCSTISRKPLFQPELEVSHDNAPQKTH